ncbi:MAG: serine/threonine-protein kinase [Lachnospiraceae bacterium]|jgi:serine/threonine protein kinase|nr:serine/threonine-protein kinase [Lachnospiraceae bacterium]
MEQNKLCMNCFKWKGEYEVCPYCGYVEGTPPAQAYDLIPGTILENRYIIGTCIGFGGFGIIYLAYDMVLGIKVAVKEFYPAGLVNRAPGEAKVGVLSGDKETEFSLQLKCFLDEARNMAIFSKDKDIVNVYHFFQANGTAYIIMEYMEGTVLKKYLAENGKMDVETAVSYMLPLLDALEKIHSQGIIHRDISPDNIFLIGEGDIKIFDFGAAKFPKGPDKMSPVVIKAGYAPPEQYRSTYQPGAFMDIYAAGAVFYEMITGIRPEEGTDRSVQDELKLPSQLGISIDKNLEKILMKALAVKPELRFQTAREFRDCIEENTEVLLPEEELKKKRRRRAVQLGLSAVGGAFFVVGVTAGIFYYMGKDILHPERIREDTISVWLPIDEEHKNNLTTELEEKFNEICPQVTLNITEIPEKAYEEKLREACKEDSLPDVFCTDSLTDEMKEYCGSVEKLYNTLDDSEYMYFEEVKDTRAVPTGIEVGIAYENVEKMQEDLKLPGLSKQQEESMERTNKSRVDKTQLLTFTEISGTPKIEWGFPEDIEEFGKADKPVRIIAGDLSCFDDILKVTVHAIPARELKVVPVLNKAGKFAAVFCDRYGINKNSTSNQQEAGMVCISCLLNESLQKEAYLTNYRALPIQKKALEQYRQLKLTGYLELVGDLLDEMEVSQDVSTIREAYYH